MAAAVKIMQRGAPVKGAPLLFARGGKMPADRARGVFSSRCILQSLALWGGFCVRRRLFFFSISLSAPLRRGFSFCGR